MTKLTVAFRNFANVPKNNCPQLRLAFVNLVKTGPGKAVLFLWEYMKLH